MKQNNTICVDSSVIRTSGTRPSQSPVFRWIPFLLFCISSVGCATCCAPDLYTYPTYGGRYERSDRERGRVGSIFSDPVAGKTVPAPNQSGTPVEPDIEPLDPNQFELPQPKPDSPTPRSDINARNRNSIRQQWR